MKKKLTSVTVVYSRGDDGWWMATVKEVAGCHTQGKSIQQARSRIREAMDVCDVPKKVIIREKIDAARKPKKAATLSYARSLRRAARLLRLPTPAELGKALLQADIDDRKQTGVTAKGEWKFTAIRYDWTEKARAVLRIIRKSRTLRA